MRNTAKQARRHAWYIEWLTDYLADDLKWDARNPFMMGDVLTEEEAEGLQSLMDNPPADLDPSEIREKVLVPVRDVLAIATEMDWALARAMLEEQSRLVVSSNRPSG